MLLIGPMPIEGDVIGGTKVSFRALVEGLQSRGLAFDVHDTSRPRAGRGRIGLMWLDVCGLAALLLRLAKGRCDVVMWNVSAGAVVKTLPLIAGLCRLRRIRLLVRVFGGDLDLFYERSFSWRRWLFRGGLVRTERLLLQTRALCERFSKLARVEWFPTTRDLPRVPASKSTNVRRFLFLAQLRREKGIVEAIEAIRNAPPEATLTVHGPAMPGFDIGALPADPRWSYGGPVPSAEVPAVLAAHDALVFPTYHSGEGLPGIVVEALQAGLPVIATRFRALEELIEDGVNGLLVPAQDSAALAAALQRLSADSELAARLAAGARTTGEELRPGPWLARLEGWLRGECASRDPR